jgi:hypothetical protein
VADAAVLQREAPGQPTYAERAEPLLRSVLHQMRTAYYAQRWTQVQKLQDSVLYASQFAMRTHSTPKVYAALTPPPIDTVQTREPGPNTSSSFCVFQQSTNELRIIESRRPCPLYKVAVQ